MNDDAREEAVKIIEKQFNDNEMDYSRKLYLILSESMSEIYS